MQAQLFQELIDVTQEIADFLEEYDGDSIFTIGFNNDHSCQSCKASIYNNKFSGKWEIDKLGGEMVEGNFCNWGCGCDGERKHLVPKHTVAQVGWVIFVSVIAAISVFF
jgi:hypothetical protein